MFVMTQQDQLECTRGTYLDLNGRLACIFELVYFLFGYPQCIYSMSPTLSHASRNRSISLIILYCMRQYSRTLQQTRVLGSGSLSSRLKETISVDLRSALSGPQIPMVRSRIIPITATSGMLKAPRRLQSILQWYGVSFPLHS